MIRRNVVGCALWLAVGASLAANANAQQPPPQPVAPASPPGQAPAPPAAELPLEPKAIEVLKASSSRLAAARTMSFTAVVSIESPSRLGPAPVYTTRSEVTLQRPDKLRVIQVADGPASEFYYDGKTMVAFAPAENLVAVAEAPPTIDATLEAAYHQAAICFPFSDVIVADPYADIVKGLELAFYIGQSRVIGGTTTDMVAYAAHGVFVQIWIGADDKLPRMPARCSPRIRCDCVTRWSSRTGSWAGACQWAPSRLNAPRRRSACRSPTRVPRPRGRRRPRPLPIQRRRAEERMP